MAPPPGEPSRDLVRRQRRRQRPDLGPAGKKRLLDVPILGPEQPVGVALDDDVTELLEPSGGTRRRAGAKRRTEALVGVLVEVESRQKLDIVVHQRFGNGAAVIGKGAIERQPSRRHLDDETIEPFGRNKIEQRRCRHEIHWTVQHAFEIVMAADGIMVARGDLGIELRIEEVPLVQKRLLELAGKYGMLLLSPAGKNKRSNQSKTEQWNTVEAIAAKNG